MLGCITRYALEALQMAVEGALWRREGMVHHSDHGVQYTSQQYRNIWKVRESGRVFYPATFPKGNVAGAPSFPDAGSLHRAVEEAIGLYNVDRPHEALGK